MASPKANGILADTIREIHRSDPKNAGNAIESRLTDYCREMTDNEKISFMADLMEAFGTHRKDGNQTQLEDSVLKEVFFLLLGRKIDADAASSQEMMERLSVALNTLFNTLNRIVKNINATLLGSSSGDQTIRRVIGSHMEGDDRREPLEDYLGRIEKAFLISHQAFKQAAHTIVRKLLQEMHPEGIAAGADKSLKFGPMRKAEYFDMYKDKFVVLERWFESGRFMSDLLREFENNCETSV